MSRPKKPTPIERLVAAMERCARNKGEAQWTNGYRTAYSQDAKRHAAEETRLYNKEMAQWTLVAEAQAAFRLLALRLLREARRSQPSRSSRSSKRGTRNG